MPCFSKIKTKMTLADRVASAMEKVGMKIKFQSDVKIETADGLVLNRSRVDLPFNASGNMSQLNALKSKYSELGVRSYAARMGMSVTVKDRQFTLTKRG